jgi:hypothetical protein
MPLQIRRGLEAERTQITPTNGLVEGELLYTTDQKKLYIGSGSVGEHQGVVITGYNDLDAKDAAAAIFADGEHTGISFTYDDETKAINAVVDLGSYNGVVVGDLVGSVFSFNDPEPILLVDSENRIFYGDLTGSVFSANEEYGLMVDTENGVFIGVHNGSVFGSVLSTNEEIGLMVDAENGVFLGSLFGEVTGNVVGDVTGSVFGDDSTKIVDAVENKVYASAGFFGNLISANGDNQTEVIPGAITIDVIEEGNLGVTLRTSLSINNGGDMFRVITNHEDTDPNEFTFLRTRGTQLEPTTVTPGDGLFALRFFSRGIDDISESASIVVSADANGTIGDEIVPGKIEFVTTNDAGVASTKLSIDKDGIIGVAANTLVAGVASGEVDTSSVSTYLKINVGGVDYAMPLYAINP